MLLSRLFRQYTCIGLISDIVYWSCFVEHCFSFTISVYEVVVEV